MIANPARGQLNRGKECFPVPVRASEFGLTRQVRSSHRCVLCILIAILGAFLPLSRDNKMSMSMHHISYEYRSLRCCWTIVRHTLESREHVVVYTIDCQ